MTFQPQRPTRAQREPLIVRPREGYLVRHPMDGQALPPEGRDVSAHRNYFERRIRHGDCERMTPEQEEPTDGR
jgi:hypothetical protein